MSARPPSGERRNSTRPPSGGERRQFGVGDWQRICDDSASMRPSTAASRDMAAPPSSFIMREEPSSGFALVDWATERLRPATAREARPWTRQPPPRPPQVRFGLKVLDVGVACNRLVAEISARCTRVARDTDWPTAEVYVWFGANALPLPMTVLAGSEATRMKETELGARLMRYARNTLGEFELRAVCAKLAHPKLAHAKQGDYHSLPVIQVFPMISSPS